MKHRKAPEKSSYSLPCAIVRDGRLLPCGTEVFLWPDQVKRIEAAARATGQGPGDRQSTETTEPE